MKIDPARAQVLLSRIQDVRQSIAAAANGKNVRLVAVSKLKPANDILALHQAPVSQLHFGENYAQELAAKAEMLPSTILWHYIGGLQTSHCKTLPRIPNLWCVSSVDTVKKAQILDRRRAEAQAPRLNVHVQVNTSGEESKSGCAPGEETVSLCRAIADECPHLHLLGLMTIGAIARSRAAAAGEQENPDFILLRAERDLVARELGRRPDELELSMGMSDDYVAAIGLGSGEVRVGSTIFGARPAKEDAQLSV